MKVAVLHWLKQVAVALDQLANALIGGWADETFSARCWRLRRLPGWRAARRVVDAVLFFDRGHCEASYRSEILRLQSPPETRLRTCPEHDTPLQE
jgi:hypothetical protein